MCAGEWSGLVNLLQWGSSPQPVTVSVSLTSIPHSYQVLPAWDPPGWSRYLSGDILNFFLMSLSLFPLSFRKCPAPDLSIGSFLFSFVKSRCPTHDF